MAPVTPVDTRIYMKCDGQGGSTVLESQTAVFYPASWAPKTLPNGIEISQMQVDLPSAKLDKWRI